VKGKKRGTKNGVRSHRWIAKRLGVSHATVIRIEKRALAKLRAALEAES